MTPKSHRVNDLEGAKKIKKGADTLLHYASK